MDIREFPGGSVIRTQRFHRGPVSRMVQKKKREREREWISYCPPKALLV